MCISLYCISCSRAVREVRLLTPSKLCVQEPNRLQLLRYFRISYTRAVQEVCFFTPKDCSYWVRYKERWTYIVFSCTRAVQDVRLLTPKEFLCKNRPKIVVNERCIKREIFVFHMRGCSESSPIESQRNPVRISWSRAFRKVRLLNPKEILYKNRGKSVSSGIKRDVHT